MEIKKGDKVKVSEDAPRMYVLGFDHIYKAYESTVLEVDDGNAVIKPSVHVRPTAKLIIPTKYLIKVDAEAKEPKIKLGDMVRVKGSLHEPFCLDADLHLEITNIPPHAVSQKEWKVIKVENRRDCAGHIYTLNNGDSFIHNIPEDCVELVEPTEQTEADKKPKVGSIKIPVEVDLTDSYWDAYAADLAKEIALKVANKYNDPKQTADYAVKVAKAVVEGLKRKRKMPLPDYCYRAWQELNTPLNPEEKERIERKWETELKKKQNKTNMKLKDLIFNREKLRKYDELKEWKEYFDENRIIIDARGRKYYRPCSKETINGVEVVIDRLPDNIKQIIISALDTEIKKLDEE